MALLPLPRFIALQSAISLGGNVAYVTEPEEFHGYVRHSRETSIFSELVKIEVETARVNSSYVHLRFCQTNRYWAFGGPGTNFRDRFVVCGSNQPEEDTSKWSCTLFEPRRHATAFLEFVLFRHVQSGLFLRFIDDSSFQTQYRRYLHADTPGGIVNSHFGFVVVDWDTLVAMPNQVAFKGDNDEYLESVLIGGHEYLRFSSDDSNEEASGFDVTPNVNGFLQFNSNLFGKFWRHATADWIWADSTTGAGTSALFWPVKVDDVNDYTIALRSRSGNNRFCTRLTTTESESHTDCLNAAVATVTRGARLRVEELVFSRNIFGVRYHFEDMRIFDENAEVVGRGSARNTSQQESTLTIVISFEDTSSYTFSNSLSIATGVSSTITAGIPRIAEASVEVSNEITNSLEWNRETSQSTTVEAQYAVVVPPRSDARVDYIATRGRCDIPFSYTQRDRRSSDGSFVNTQKSDGMFTGANYYNFHFDNLEMQHL